MTPGAQTTARYRARNLESCRESVRAYQATPRGKEVIAAYKASPDRKEALAKYNASEKARIAKAKYRKTEKNRIAQRRFDATPQGKLRRSLRDRVRKVLKRGKGVRPGSAVRDLGCSIEFFKAFIESQFIFGMSWANYGHWHLDHIRPLASFDLTDRSQFLQAVHYTNYQPLWAEENKRKAAHHG
jgi:hypothetical protein